MFYFVMPGPPGVPIDICTIHNCISKLINYFFIPSGHKEEQPFAEVEEEAAEISEEEQKGLEFLLLKGETELLTQNPIYCSKR